jgi:uncharacterized protein (DUF849 family)
MHKTWIEAALNGPWSRQRQPGIPDTVEAIVADGIACAQAGACIIHVHAYDGGGPQTFAWQVYARIIEGIRGRIDVPVYPSIPSAGIGTGPMADDPRNDSRTWRPWRHAACWSLPWSIPAASTSQSFL